VLRETGVGRYAFRHVLAQQVAYRHVPGPRRARLHRRAVEELQTHDPAPLVQIAHHTLATGDREGWLVRVEQAADQAVALGDTGTAATLLHQILNQSDVGAGQRSRAALALARIADYGTDYAASARLLRDVLADPLLPEAARGEVRLGLGLIMVNVASDQAGLRELERAVDELATVPDKAARAMIALANGDHDSDAARAWGWLDRAEEAVRHSTDDAIRVAVQATRLTLMAREGDPAVWALTDRLPRRSTDSAVLAHTCRALHNVSMAAIELGHDRRARALLLENLDLAQRMGDRRYDCLNRVRLLYLDWVAARWDGLEAGFVDLKRAYPDVTMVDLGLALCRGRLAVVQGRYSQAFEHFAAAKSHTNVISDDLNIEISTELIAARLAQGDPQAAWAVAEPAMSVLRGFGDRTRITDLFPVSVEAALAAGRRDEAERLVAEAEAKARGWDAPAAAAECDLVRGLLLRDTEPATAAEHFVAAHQRWQDIGRPYHAAKAAEHLGNVLACALPADAATHLAESARAYTEIGATADAARCQHALRSLGVGEPGRRGRRGYGGELSPRELEVAELLARAATNQDIAQVLFLSPRTVEKHVARVLAKLGTARQDVHAALANSAGAGTRPPVVALPPGG
jgi:DNA-binding NarL/FixJ family response regulator